MEHVIVETNWVIDYVAPAHFREPSAVELLKRAEDGDIKLYIPNIAFVEARKVINEKGRFQVRDEVAGIREYLKLQIAIGRIAQADRVEIDKILSQYDEYVNVEKRKSPARITELLGNRAVNIIPLDETMLARSTALVATDDVNLQSFDLAILATVLVWSERMRLSGNTISFCEKDSDLQPWIKDMSPKHTLMNLYKAQRVWVYGDFTMSWPRRPDEFI